MNIFSFINLNYKIKKPKKRMNTLFKESGFCRIKNYGYNWDLISGLQIISRCDIFINWLNEVEFLIKDFPFLNSIKDIINKILHSEYFDPLRFINYFFSQNNEFRPNEQNCSQLFIRTFFYIINKEIL